MVNLRLVEHLEQVTGIQGGRMALRPDEVAVTLGLSTTKVKALCRAGTIPAIKLGGDWLIPHKQLDAWLEQNIGKYVG